MEYSSYFLLFSLKWLLFKLYHRTRQQSVEITSLMLKLQGYLSSNGFHDSLALPHQITGAHRVSHAICASCCCMTRYANLVGWSAPLGLSYITWLCMIWIHFISFHLLVPWFFFFSVRVVHQMHYLDVGPFGKKNTWEANGAELELPELPLDCNKISVWSTCTGLASLTGGQYYVVGSGSTIGIWVKDGFLSVGEEIPHRKGLSVWSTST